MVIGILTYVLTGAYEWCVVAMSVIKDLTVAIWNL